MQWYKYDSDITTGLTGKYIWGTLQNPSLTITDFQLDDQGVYNCLAFNSYGKNSSFDFVAYLDGGNGVFKYIKSIFALKHKSSKMYNKLT